MGDGTAEYVGQKRRRGDSTPNASRGNEACKLAKLVEYGGPAPLHLAQRTRGKAATEILILFLFLSVFVERRTREEEEDEGEEE